MIKTKGLTVEQFLKLLQDYTERNKDRPWDTSTVCIPLTEPSIGGVAVTHISSGFDWDKGKLFLSIEEPVCRSVKISREEAEAYGKKIADYYKENKLGGFHHRKYDVWMDGFMEGVKYGSRKLVVQS